MSPPGCTYSLASFQTTLYYLHIKKTTLYFYNIHQLRQYIHSSNYFYKWSSWKMQLNMCTMNSWSWQLKIHKPTALLLLVKLMIIKLWINFAWLKMMIVIIAVCIHQFQNFSPSLFMKVTLLYSLAVFVAFLATFFIDLKSQFHTFSDIFCRLLWLLHDA